jgi:hypothetical protein
MRLRSLVYEKELLEKKIVELKDILLYDASDDIAQELFGQLELLQAKKINIHTINNQIKITLGGKEVDISTAIVLRDTAKNKIDILTSLIINNECGLNKLELMKQRDDLYEEYTLLSNEVVASDLNVTIGE